MADVVFPKNNFVCRRFQVWSVAVVNISFCATKFKVLMQ